MDIGAWRATVYGVAESNLTEQLATFLYAFNFKWNPHRQGSLAGYSP